MLVVPQVRLNEAVSIVKIVADDFERQVFRVLQAAVDENKWGSLACNAKRGPEEQKLQVSLEFEIGSKPIIPQVPITNYVYLSHLQKGNHVQLPTNAKQH